MKKFFILALSLTIVSSSFAQDKSVQSGLTKDELRVLLSIFRLTDIKVQDIELLSPVLIRLIDAASDTSNSPEYSVTEQEVQVFRKTIYLYFKPFSDIDAKLSKLYVKEEKPKKK